MKNHPIDEAKRLLRQAARNLAKAAELIENNSTGYNTVSLREIGNEVREQAGCLEIHLFAAGNVYD